MVNKAKINILSKIIDELINKAMSQSDNLLFITHNNKYFVFVEDLTDTIKETKYYSIFEKIKSPFAILLDCPSKTEKILTVNYYNNVLKKMNHDKNEINKLILFYTNKLIKQKKYKNMTLGAATKAIKRPIICTNNSSLIEKFAALQNNKPARKIKIHRSNKYFYTEGKLKTFKDVKKEGIVPDALDYVNFSIEERNNSSDKVYNHIKNKLLNQGTDFSRILHSKKKFNKKNVSKIADFFIEYNIIFNYILNADELKGYEFVFCIFRNKHIENIKNILHGSGIQYDFDRAQ